MALLAETTGVFGETAAGVTLGALREAVRRGEPGPTTSRAPRHGRRAEDARAGRGRLQPVEIEADADALLERLGAAA